MKHLCLTIQSKAFIKKAMFLLIFIKMLIIYEEIIC
jgi:hypothetical protein